MLTLTDSTGARVTDATVDCSAIPTGEGETGGTSGGGIYFCGRRGGRYLYQVFWRGALVSTGEVDTPGDYCHPGSTSTPVFITLVPPTVDAGVSADASTDGGTEQ